MDLPVNVSTGEVVGRYIADVIDGPDTNLDPDALPVQGRIVFTASVPYLPNPTAGPDPVTIMRVPIVGVLDQEGYLCTPYPGTLEPQYRGVRLIATDDPDISVTNWTWDVTYIFEPVNGHKLAIPAHGFALPSGGTVDLTKVAKVPSSPGYSLPQAEAAALRAEEAALTSAQDAADALAAALRSEQAAAATDQGITDMLANPSTQSGGLLAEMLDPKANADDVAMALADKAGRQEVESLIASKADAAETTEALGTKANQTSVDSALGLKADKSTVETALADKASVAQLATKADLQSGKVPVGQLPTDALVTDSNVAAQINGAQTGAAIDSRITTKATPLVQPIVADYIASQPAVVDAAAAAVNANPKIATIEAALPWRGVLPNGTDINTVRLHGIYTVATTSAAGTMVNWPTSRAGILKVWTNDGASATTQEITAYVSTTAPTERYSRGSLSSANTNWSPWASDGWAQGILPNGTNASTFRSPGVYATNGTGYTGLPSESAGVLEVVTFAGTGQGFQRFMATTGGKLQVWERHTRTTSGFPEWIERTSGGGYYRGILADGTDVDTFRESGVWAVTAIGTITGLPTLLTGMLEVVAGPGTGLGLQRYTVEQSGAIRMWERVTRLTSGFPAWSERPVSAAPQVMPDGTDVDTLKTNSVWIIKSAASAITMIGLPQNASGLLEVIIAPGSARAFQRLTLDAGGSYPIYDRSTGLTSSWPAFVQRTGGGGGGETPTGTVAEVMRDSAHRHGILRNHFKARRGGVIGAQGMGVYAIRIDHWLADFERDLMPAIVANNLPVSICMNSQNWGVPVTVPGAEAPGDGNNGLVEPATLQEWSLYNGFGIANHSRTHAGTNDPDGIINETIGGQQELQLQLPRLVIDEWHMPGVSSNIAYDGFGNGNRLEVWMDKLAGKAILHSHGHASGYMQGFWHELTGEPQIGEMPQGADNRLLTDRKADIDQIIAQKKGLVHLIHGNAIASGQLTVEDWENFCAYVAGKRDAGELLVLTTAGEAVASSRTDYREQIVQNRTWGESFKDWTGTTGWTVTNPGLPDAVAAGTDTSGMLTQVLLMHSRHGWVQGSQVELVAQVRTTSAVYGKFAMEVYDLSNQANFNLRKSFTIPSDNEWVWVRMNFTIPRVGDLTQMRISLGRDAEGGSLEIRNLAFQPI